MVDIDFIYIQDALLRVRWLKPLAYEINLDEASIAIIALLAKDFDKDAKLFGTYDIVKTRVNTNLKIASSMRKKDKIIKKLKTQFGVDDEEEDNEEEAKEEGPLAIK